jgi:hypothetical protein
LDLTKNSIFVIGDNDSPFTLRCNRSDPNQQITWIQTVNNTGVYFVELNDRISTTSNGGALLFTNLTLYDEEYYGCGYTDPATNKFKLINSYYVYVRGN